MEEIRNQKIRREEKTMDKEKAKEFLFDDPETHNIYISKDLQKLIDMNDGNLFLSMLLLKQKAVILLWIWIGTMQENQSL